MRILGVMAVFMVGAAVAFADDVSQFRGSKGTGVSTETNLPVQWNANENVRWKAELPGRGLSSPVIAKGRVYVTACDGYEQKRQLVLCFDVKTGKKLWVRQVWGTGTTLCHPKTNMAAPTPLTDGDHVYALFATGDLVCFDRDGDLVWYRSLVGDYPTVGNNVGMAASPALWRDRILVCMENVGESFAAGIDTKTGQNRWRVERPRGINWVTPTVIDHDGQAAVVFQGAADLTAYEPAGGQKLWSLTSHKFATMASATVRDSVVFLPGDKFVAIQTPKANEEPKVLWENTKLRPQYASPLAYKNRLYTVGFNGIVNCSDADSGKVIWTHRLEGAYAASPLLAEGRLYVVAEDGTTHVMEASDEAKVLASNSVKDTILASPVAYDQAVFLRSDKYLYCFSGKK